MELHAASFNTLDYIVLGIILVSGLLAILSGFIREIYSLFNWIASYYVAVHYYTLVEPFVKKHISNHTTAMDASIFIVFCLCFIVLAILGSLVTGFIRGGALTAIDRSLGFAFGIVRGVLIVCIIYLVGVTVLWPDIDKPQTAPTSIEDTMPTAKDEPAIKKERQQLSMAAPEWLMYARTRPMMARGAALLKEFIPEKVLEKTAEGILQGKDAAEKKIDQGIDRYTDDKLGGKENQK